MRCFGLSCSAGCVAALALCACSTDEPQTTSPLPDAATSSSEDSATSDEANPSDDTGRSSEPTGNAARDSGQGLQSDAAPQRDDSGAAAAEDSGSSMVTVYGRDASAEHTDSASNLPHLDAGSETSSGGDGAVHEAPSVSQTDAATVTPHDAATDAARPQTCAECKESNCLAERDACSTDECLPLLQCYEETACANVPGTTGDSTGCFCGDLEPLDCFSAGDEAAGACVVPIRAAMGNDAPSSSDVLLRWTNPDYAGGRVNLLYACEYNACAAPCGW